MVAGAAALLTACTSESENGPSNNISYESIKAAEQVPVTFGTYMGETAITRAGTAGSIEAIPDDPATGGVDESKTIERVLANKGGFGVFSYYTDDSNYVPTASTGSKPNFMYNQLVSGTDNDTPTWSYSPIKYWPNEYGPGAVSSNRDKLSFFAYAPYVAVTPSTGVVTGSPNDVGIIKLTANTYGGDPLVSFVFDNNPAQSVDLMYGVANADTPYGIEAPTESQKVVAGAPFLNMTKQTAGNKIKFNFKHALARLGLTIQGAFDDDTAGAGSLDSNTKITVKSVEILGDNFFASGDLNLNTGLWGNTVEVSPADLITIDSQINPDIIDEGADRNTMEDGLIAGSKTGVDTTERPVATSSATNYYMLIPSTSATPAEQTKITGFRIKYYVNTADAKLEKTYSRVENVITKNVATSITVEKGKAYKFKLCVGMTTVKIDAAVTSWDTTFGEEEVWLPINVD
jgi:hypothetical protein